MSLVRFRDPAAPLPLDGNSIARASLPACDPGVGLAETVFQHLRHLCPGLPHRKQVRRLAVVASSFMIAPADR